MLNAFTYYYCITGANGGLGLESARQLALLHHQPSSSDLSSETTTCVFLLCRRESSANEAISALQTSSSSANHKVNFIIFVQFDSSDRPSVEAAVAALSKKIPDGQHIDGLLCNAGGFTSDTKGTRCKSGATIIAETNLIGHAALVDGLLQSKKIASGKSRVVFSASEAGLGEPFAIKWGNDVQYYSSILDGSK
jgi:NAD(P)-dependent dehydrogenase (short-subunit alcohol dehydrogenase family)